MYCPYCSCDCPDSAGFCPNCGAPLAHAPSQPEPVPLRQQTPPQTKPFGTHRVPILIMAALFVIGLTLFYALPGSQPDRTDPGMNIVQPNSETPWFSIEDGVLSFHEEFYDGPPELTVPETVDGQTVTALGSYCFLYVDGITTVILPDTLERIEYCAFSGCRDLRGIFLPEGIREIGSDSFQDCASLEAICIPSTVESIGSQTFQDCLSLKYILYNGAFEDWAALYQELIHPKTQVYCTDGIYPHTGVRP